MTIVDTPKFVIGLAFLLVGVAFLVLSRGSRGFDQRKQAGALLLVGAVIFVAIGLGYLEW